MTYTVDHGDQLVADVVSTLQTSAQRLERANAAGQQTRGPLMFDARHGVSRTSGSPYAQELAQAMKTTADGINALLTPPQRHGDSDLSSHSPSNTGGHSF